MMATRWCQVTVRPIGDPAGPQLQVGWRVNTSAKEILVSVMADGRVGEEAVRAITTQAMRIVTGGVLELPLEYVGVIQGWKSEGHVILQSQDQTNLVELRLNRWHRELARNRSLLVTMSTGIG